MTVERVIDLLLYWVSPENAEEENEALGKAARILQLVSDNKHLHIHRMRRRYRFIGDGRKNGDLPVEVEGYFYPRPSRGGRRESSSPDFRWNKEGIQQMSNKIRRIFRPTPEEELEDIRKIAEIRESLKGTCSVCIHHEETDLPGYFTDYGRCRVESPLFGDIVTNPLVKCPSYQDREQTSGPTVKCRYVYGDNICEKYSGNGEIIYCVEGPCPYDMPMEDE